MNSLCKKIVAVVVFAGFLAGGILTLALKDRSFSEAENRNLSQAPKVSGKSLLNGTFQRECETYLSDQFVGRDALMQLYGLGQTAMLKTDYNNVYLCQDGRLIEKYTTPVNTDSIINKFNSFAQNTDMDCALMLVPTAISIYSETLPANAGQNNAQREVYDKFYSQVNMQTVEVWSSLETNKNSTNLYYYTDHHWTTEAAYLAYVSYCETKGIEPNSKDFYNITTVSTEFYGTIMSKALSPLARADEIKAPELNMSGITVSYQNGEGVLFEESYLEKKDKYSYFLNGIKPVIIIDNANVNNGKTLLVVKDSYANCLVPFLIGHYERVVVLDTRYYINGASFAAKEYGATDCLFLFNLNTLDAESAINGIY